MRLSPKKITITTLALTATFCSTLSANFEETGKALDSIQDQIIDKANGTAIEIQETYKVVGTQVDQTATEMYNHVKGDLKDLGALAKQEAKILEENGKAVAQKALETTATTKETLEAVKTQVEEKAAVIYSRVKEDIKELKALAKEEAKAIKEKSKTLVETAKE